MPQTEAGSQISSVPNRLGEEGSVLLPLGSNCDAEGEDSSELSAQETDHHSNASPKAFDHHYTIENRRNKTPERLPGSKGSNVAKKPNAQKAATNKPTAIRMNFRLMFITIGSLGMLVVDCLSEPYG